MKNCIKNVVKNIVEAVFPERCRGCGVIGGFLCERCKKYISEKGVVREIGEKGDLPRAEYLGFRDEILGEMVEECKYAPARGLCAEVAEVVFSEYFEPSLNRGGGSLNERVLKKSGVKTSAGSPLILVPMPTSRRHVRERGFDHMDLICREVAKLSGGSVRRVRLLERAKDTVQVGASSEVRRKQAKEAVRVNPRFMEDSGRVLEEYREVPVVLMDDVWTTGASLTEAGKMLMRAGVKDLRVLAVTKNRSQKRPVIRHGEID
ncbi:ComF family protein [Candidatus Saccharibacteria bacterium]|nr:ComF family protein [Candidatus Saccharibacteria bacterium]